MKKPEFMTSNPHLDRRRAGYALMKARTVPDTSAELKHAGAGLQPETSREPLMDISDDARNALQTLKSQGWCLKWPPAVPRWFEHNFQRAFRCERALVSSGANC
jgi:hypothetical protein